MSVIVIGDLHGCVDEFRELLNLCDYSKAHDRLILCGDLVDRGPDPLGVIHLAMEQGAESVLGNHDEKHLRYARHEAVRKATGKKNPMRPFPPKRLKEHEALVADEKAFEWLSRLPLWIEHPDWVVVHAGLEPCIARLEDQSDRVLRIRYVDDAGKMLQTETTEFYPKDMPEGGHLWADKYSGRQDVFFGHAVHSLTTVRSYGGYKRGTCYALDTGCVFGGHLSAAVLSDLYDRKPDVEVVQVKAKRNYAEDERKSPGWQDSGFGTK